MNIAHNWQRCALHRFINVLLLGLRCHLNFINTEGFNNSFLGILRPNKIWCNKSHVISIRRYFQDRKSPHGVAQWGWGWWLVNMSGCVSFPQKWTLTRWATASLSITLPLPAKSHQRSHSACLLWLISLSIMHSRSTHVTNAGCPISGQQSYYNTKMYQTSMMYTLNLHNVIYNVDFKKFIFKKSLVRAAYLPLSLQVRS